MKNEDWGEFFLYAGLAGAVASNLKSLAHHLLAWLIRAEQLYFELNAYLIHGHTTVKGFADIAFSILGDSILGAAFGFLTAAILRRTPLRLHYWLGLGTGLILWFGSLAFGNIAKILKAPETDHMSLFALLVGMLLFGLIFIWLSHLWRPLRRWIMQEP